MAEPFSPQAIQAAIGEAMQQQPDVLNGKHGVLLVMASTDGVKAVFAAKIDDVWEFDGLAEWHGGTKVSAGVQLKASW